MQISRKWSVHERYRQIFMLCLVHTSVLLRFIAVPK